MIYALYGYGSYDDDDECADGDLHVFKTQTDRELWTAQETKRMRRDFFTSYYLLEANCSIDDLPALSYVAMQTTVEGEIIIWTKTDDGWDYIEKPILIETKPTKVKFTNLDEYEIQNLDEFQRYHAGSE